MKLLLSKEEARKFCTETWFPKLKIGHESNTEAFNKGLDNLLQLFTPEIEISDYDNKDNVGTDISKGYEQVRKYFEYMLKTYPTLGFNILDIFPTEKGFILWYAGKNVPHAPKFQGMAIVELTKVDNHFKMSKLVEFYNILPFIKQPVKD